MLRKFLICSVVFLSACSVEKGGSILSPEIIPSSVSNSDNRVGLSSLATGTWTGSETATVGLSGTLSATFTQVPANNSLVTATITWTGGITVHGTVTGTLDNMTITATDGPAGTCGYIAHGTLNQAGTQITGTYTGTGTGKCTTKAGTFVLNGQSAVLPQLNCVDQFWQMNQGSSNAKQNACSNRGGIWRGDNYDIPNDSSSTTYNSICEFTPNPPGSPGNDMTLIFSKEIACPVN